MNEAARPEPAPAGPPHLADPRALTVLTTEHWGLLTARSLAYNEAFARAGIDLTFLSASLVALGFIAAAGVEGAAWIAVAVLALDLLVGLATAARMVSAVIEEFLALQAMARIRHAYLEMVPTLAPYLPASRYDTLESVMGTYGPGSPGALVGLKGVLHGVTTAAGMVSVVNSAVAGALAAVTVIAVGGPPLAGLALGIAAGILVLVAHLVAIPSWMVRRSKDIEVRFPAPAGMPQDGRRTT